MSTKFYSNKSNALRAAKKVEGAYEIRHRNGEGYYVHMLDAEPTRDINEDVEAAAPVAEAEAAAPVDAIAEERALPGSPTMMFIAVPADNAVSLAGRLASFTGMALDVVNPRTGNVLQRVEPTAKPARKAQAASGSPRASRIKGDLTVKPVVTATSQLRMQAMFDRIEAARGDLANLQALNKFSRSGTYYKMAGRYIDALIEEAKALDAAPVGELVAA